MSHLQSLSQLGGVLIGVGVVVSGAAWLARATHRLHLRIKGFLDDWDGLAARSGRPAIPGVMESIATLRVEVTEIRAETKPNAGFSLRDVVQKIASDLSSHHESIARLRGDVAELRGRMELFEAERIRRDLTREPIAAIRHESEQQHRDSQEAHREIEEQRFEDQQQADQES